MARYTVQMTYETPALDDEFAHGARIGKRGQVVNLIGRNGRLAVTATISADSPEDAATSAGRHVAEIWARRGRGPLQLQTWTASRIRMAGVGRGLGPFSEPNWNIDWFGDDEGGGLAGVREPRQPLPDPGSMSVELPIPGSPEAVA